MSVAVLLVGCGSEPRNGTAAEAESGVTGAPANAVEAAPPSMANEAAGEREAPALALEAEGLRFFDPNSGSASPLPFGAPKEQTLKALTASFETPPAEQGTMEGCGAGPVDQARWPNGFVALFQDDKFLGWEVRQAGLTTADRIGIGSTRQALDESQSPAVEESTLGTEFHSGELGGLLSSAKPDAKVTALWAGLTCFFR
ncbi:MAG TPA: hypothetical protein VF727_02965 [Allosphingosinicella sp.]